MTVTDAAGLARRAKQWAEPRHGRVANTAFVLTEDFLAEADARRGNNRPAPSAALHLAKSAPLAARTLVGTDLTDIAYRAKHWAEGRDNHFADTIHYLAEGFIEELEESAYGQCDYYLNTGTKTCSNGCHDEPLCRTGQWGDDGWPDPPGALYIAKSVPSSVRAAIDNQNTPGPNTKQGAI